LAFLASFLAAYGGKKEMSSGDTPHPGKGLRPLHSFYYDIDHWRGVNLSTLIQKWALKRANTRIYDV